MNLPIQRAANDNQFSRLDGDFSSPVLRDDPKLLACKENKARLRIGDVGKPVSVVQSILKAAGLLDVVDGRYGHKTANAVKRYKADRSLGSEQFGDVGPGTLNRMDFELTAGVLPSPVIELD